MHSGETLNLHHKAVGLPTRFAVKRASQDFCCRDYGEVFLGLFAGFRHLVLWVMHIVPLCLGLFGVFPAG
jgi:hypothetical protein